MKALHDHPYIDDSTTVIGVQVMDAELRGGDARGNAAIVRGVLAGEGGAKRDVVLLNAGYALAAAGKAASVAEGIGLAAEAIDSGRALAQVEKLVALTNV